MNPESEEREFTCCILIVFCFMRLANAKAIIISLFAASSRSFFPSIFLADQVYID